MLLIAAIVVGSAFFFQEASVSTAASVKPAVFHSGGCFLSSDCPSCGDRIGYCRNHDDGEGECGC